MISITATPRTPSTTRPPITQLIVLKPIDDRNKKLAKIESQ